MKEKFTCISSIVRVASPLSSTDRGLELVASSMWSTMTVTGICFAAVLFAFLMVRVGKSMASESAQAGGEPLKLSFLLSFSGLKYIHNHVRHHLFQTPLLPRRRFSSLKRTNSWIPVPEVFRRRGSSTAQEVELLGSTEVPRRSSLSTSTNSTSSSYSSSSSSSQTKRRSSIKRASLPANVWTESNTSNSMTTNANTTSQSTGQSTTSSNQTSTRQTRSQTRRNTMPHISVKESPVVVEETPLVEPVAVDQVDVVVQEQVPVQIQVQAAVIPTPTPIAPQTTPQMYMIAEEEEELTGSEESLLSETNSDQLEQVIAYLEAEDSDSDSEEEEEERIQVQVQAPVQPSSSTRRSSAIEISNTTTASASSASSSFRSSYLNYLPESIFGYSTTSIFAKSPDAPPGFSKRYTDWLSGSSSTTSLNSSSNSSSSSSLSSTTTQSTTSHSTSHQPTSHQPLYARKPSIDRESRLTSLLSSTRRHTFSTLNASAPQFIPSTAAMTGKEEPLLIERAATASPRLEELQNTSDLFAPINWNFDGGREGEGVEAVDEAEEAIRRVWGSNDHDRDVSSSSTRKRAMSVYASSIFN